MKLNEVMTRILEGPNDPHIFKAVFMLGGPGSGKSMVSRKLFSGTGLKFVDPDKILEYLLAKHDVSMDLKKDSPDRERQMAARRVASDKHFKRLDTLIDGRIGLVVDGTGKVFRRINMMRKKLEDLGYDTAAVYVKVDVDTAQERNQKRKRSVDPEVVKNIHSAVNQNAEAYEYTFGNDFYVVNNTDMETLNNSLPEVERSIRRWLSQPPQKPEAREWLAQFRQQ